MREGLRIYAAVSMDHDDGFAGDYLVAGLLRRGFVGLAFAMKVRRGLQ
jgi:hypothetical protein